MARAHKWLLFIESSANVYIGNGIQVEHGRYDQALDSSRDEQAGRSRLFTAYHESRIEFGLIRQITLHFVNGFLGLLLIQIFTGINEALRTELYSRLCKKNNLSLTFIPEFSIIPIASLEKNTHSDVVVS
jgi:hypothetical protein